LRALLGFLFGALKAGRSILMKPFLRAVEVGNRPSTAAIMSGVRSATSQNRRRVAKPNYRQVMTEMVNSIIQIVSEMR
jgi:hypothetical protein